MTSIINRVKQGLIVSSQASHGEPLNRSDILCAMAESALQGGACGIRMAQVENLRYFRERHPQTPLIGITKPDVIPPDAAGRVYITPTFQDVAAVAPYCDIVALDATHRPRPFGETLEAIVRQSRERFPATLLMADIATLEDGLEAERLGFDLIGTTLSGYTLETETPKRTGPDFELLEALVQQAHTPIILEGRVWEPGDVTQGFVLGAHAIVVGSAVTRPYEITRRFIRVISASGNG